MTIEEYRDKIRKIYAQYPDGKITGLRDKQAIDKILSEYAKEKASGEAITIKVMGE